MKQKMWLQIARHVIEEKKDVSQAMHLLEECGDLIKIEDIIPYFPEFVTIDEFKDAIKDSLSLYMSNIDSLKEDIEQAATSAESIRREIQVIKSRSVTATSSDKCLLCKYPLLTRRFYIFPCAHKFHFDCYYKSVAKVLLPSKKKVIDELILRIQEAAANTNVVQAQSSMVTSMFGSVTGVLNQKLFNVTPKSKGTQPTSSSTAVMTPEEINRLKADLDDQLASECVMCGENMIRRVDEPFFDLDEYKQIYDSWL